MLKHFRYSPLWLISLFVIFAEGISTIAAIQLSGWIQATLVIFIISYASVVTIIFFLFLWLKPENFYSPTDYASTTPTEFIDTFRGAVPKDIQEAVNHLSVDPHSQSKRFQLLANLLPEETKQHLILMQKNKVDINITPSSVLGFTHRYEILMRGGGISIGVFMPAQFLKLLNGTELVTSNNREIKLSPHGELFATWLIDSCLDAKSFQSDIGSWGELFNVGQILEEQYNKFNKSDSIQLGNDA